MIRYLVVFSLGLLLIPRLAFSSSDNLSCYSSKDCRIEMYCRFSEGDCGKKNKAGECKVKPEICTMDYTPVCGCDLVLYPNACKAASQGISVMNKGECRVDKN